MDTFAVGSAMQGVVNQAANKTSTQQTETVDKADNARLEQDAKAAERVAAELKTRIDQILAQVKEKGAAVNTEASRAKQIEKPRETKQTYIDVLRDVLVGKTSVNTLKYESPDGSASQVLGDGKPTYPFNQSFWTSNLEMLRSLLTGDGGVDKQLVDRIEKQLEELAAPQPVGAAAPAADNAAPQPKSLDEIV
jgi:hypothetical protein